MKAALKKNAQGQRNRIKMYFKSFSKIFCPRNRRLHGFISEGAGGKPIV